LHTAQCGGIGGKRSPYLPANSIQIVAPEYRSSRRLRTLCLNQGDCIIGFTPSVRGVPEHAIALAGAAQPPKPTKNLGLEHSRACNKKRHIT
jgi:hypothetical protein